MQCERKKSYLVYVATDGKYMLYTYAYEALRE